MTPKKKTETEEQEPQQTEELSELAREFAGMGSHAARARELAEPARPVTPLDQRDREAEAMRRHVVGDVDRVARGWDDMATRSPTDFQRPDPERQEVAARRAAAFWDEQVKLGAGMQRDRVSARHRTPGNEAPTWEQLAAQAHAEQSRTAVGDPAPPSHHDPDADPIRPGERSVKHTSRGMGFTHDTRGVR